MMNSGLRFNKTREIGGGMYKEVRLMGRGEMARRFYALGLLALATLMVALPGSSKTTYAAEVVEQIIVSGNQRVEATTVRSYMRVKVGQELTSAQIDEALKRLFATGLFADVTIRQEGRRVTVLVQENPIINRVAFEGNDAISNEDLTQEVQLSPRTVYTRAKVQADTQRIIDLHRRSGRFSAKVEPKIIRLPQNRIDLVFEIDEGPVTGIGGINFLGNDVYSDSDLRDVISTGETAWWKFLSSSDSYDPDRLTYDRELLRRFYLSKGYADFTVVSAVADLSRDGEEFYITFTVEEGPQYTFGAMEIDTTLEKLKEAELENTLKTKEGDIYNADFIDDTVEGLTFLAGIQGYAFAEVRPRVRRDKETLTAAITYKISEGPRVYVERINVNGNARTLDKVIRRQMKLSEGDAFNRILLKSSEGRINALGYFSSVEVIEEPGSSPDKTIINVDVQEQSTGDLSLGFGFSSVDNAVADASITERNFMGRGQYLRLGLSLAARRQTIDLRFTEPYFMDRNLSAGIDIFGTETDFQDEASYDSRVTGFGFRFGFPLSSRSRLTARYTLRMEEITNVASTASLFITERSDIRSSIGFNYSLDRRNDPVRPTRGWDFNFDQEFTGVGGSVKYLKSKADWRMYHGFNEDFQATLGLSGGYVDGIGQKVIINDRFFVGGSDFRGFERAGVGARDLETDDALGAEAYAIASAELTFPNFLPEALDIDTSIFVDAGYVGLSDDEDIFSSTGTALTEVEDKLAPRLSAGLSVYWKSPFGPVRLDFSHAFLKEDYDKTEAFRFSAGTRF